MLGQTFIILSEDERLEKIIARFLPGIRVVLCRSLDQLLPGLKSRGLRILLDPLCARLGCLEEIRRLERRLDIPVKLGQESSLGQNGHRQWSPSNARIAWMNRARVLAAIGRSGAARSFLRAAREHDHRGLAVSEAAASMGVSVRQLYRLSWKAFGNSPGLIIDLARVVSVAEAVEGSAQPIATIAHEHGFSDQPAMNRQFARFVGEPPSVHRAYAVLQRIRGLSNLAEITNGADPQDGVLGSQQG